MAKIPERAKKVFEGVIFDVYQYDQEMYDGSVEVFESLSRPDTAEVLVVVGDKIIIQDQQQPHKPEPFLSIVGGRIEKGEDPLEGAKRETLEETGYASEDWELVFEDQPSGKIDWSIYVYIARGAEKVAEQSLDAGEKINLRFISFEELLDLIDRDELRHLASDLRAELIRAKYDPERRVAWEARLFKK